MSVANGGVAPRYVELLPGRSAIGLAQATLSLLLAAMALTLGMAMIMGTRDAAPGSLTSALVAVVGTLMAIVWPIALTRNGLAYRRKVLEYRSGYTTLLGEEPAYPQVDPTYGWVIRAPGEPALSRREWKAACARAVAAGRPVSV